ncbi:hypothetical protein ZHAS_00014854 [Anopheles sinensis]|uniref:Uncharacterized protein n=1 Tax=Anopheles sinensis TaxID=74873 RepID=A0A084W9F6_ANOSI|nr:hypothetical protein ZHAS_00014854 [Anopheles sinensis]
MDSSEVDGTTHREIEEGSRVEKLGDNRQGAVTQSQKDAKDTEQQRWGGSGGNGCGLRQNEGGTVAKLSPSARKTHRRERSEGLHDAKDVVSVLAPNSNECEDIAYQSYAGFDSC